MKLFSFISILPVLFFLNKKVLFHSSANHLSTVYTAFNDSLPPLPEAPKIKRGWTGKFTCTLKLNGKGNQPKPYSYYVNLNRVHTGYIELTGEVKGPIRVNSPEKNNAERWESWIPQGRKKGWNYINDSLHQVTVITSDVCCRTPHNNFNTVKAGSATAWKEGDLHGYDLQIDYKTGTYILSAPIMDCDAEQKDIWHVNKNVVPKNKYLRNVNETKTVSFKTYGYFNQMDTITGTIQRGQKEIVIRSTAPYSYVGFLWHDKQGKAVNITPIAKGMVEFTLVLTKAGT